MACPVSLPAAVEGREPVVVAVPAPDRSVIKASDENLTIPPHLAAVRNVEWNIPRPCSRPGILWCLAKVFRRSFVFNKSQMSGMAFKFEI